VKKRQVRVDNLSADSEQFCNYTTTYRLLKKIYFTHTNSSGIVRKFFKIFPSQILASLKESHLFAVIETKNVCRFLPTVKPPNGLVP
jgi:hypothetical protein